MNETKDISIGNDKWIKWIEFDQESVEPKNIDSLLNPTKIFWKHIEVECVAECCGIDAFSFLDKDIRNACKKVGMPNLEEYSLKIPQPPPPSPREEGGVTATN